MGAGLLDVWSRPHRSLDESDYVMTTGLAIVLTIPILIVGMLFLDLLPDWLGIALPLASLIVILVLAFAGVFGPTGAR